MEIILAIAALCQISAGGTKFGFMDERIKEEQISCHKYYAKCVNHSYNQTMLLTCMKKRTVK